MTSRSAGNFSAGFQIEKLGFGSGGDDADGNGERAHVHVEMIHDGSLIDINPHYQTAQIVAGGKLYRPFLFIQSVPETTTFHV